jgi:glutamine amidotransferase-like uncharacterized protein
MNTKTTFLVYTDHPMCSVDCSDAVCDVLNQTGLYDAKMIGPSSYPYIEFSTENIQDVNCIVMPGGWGDSDQFDKRLPSTKTFVQDYVQKGGKYLGICMGSYFASHHYYDLLQGYTAKQYIKRKDSTVKKDGPHIVDISWRKSPLQSMYFHDGAAFIPNGEEIKQKTKILGKYTNGDIAALTQKCGKGKLGLVGPHPEALKWWFYSQRRIKENWKDSIRHDLFLDLVTELLK